MICPHCKKLIDHEITDSTKKRIYELHKEGYSSRDIEKLLFAEGIVVSFGSIARILRNLKGKL